LRFRAFEVENDELFQGITAAKRAPPPREGCRKPSGPGNNSWARRTNSWPRQR